MKYYLRFILSLFSLIIYSFSFSQDSTQFQINWAQLSYNNGELRPGLIAKDLEGYLYVMTTIKPNTSVTLNGTTVSGGNLGVGAIIKYDSNQNPVLIKEIPFVIQAYDNIAPHKFIFQNGSLYLFTVYRQDNVSMNGISFPPISFINGTAGAGNLVLIKMDATNLQTKWIKLIKSVSQFVTLPPDNLEIYFDKKDKIHAVGTFSNKLIFIDSNDTLVDNSDTVGVNAFHAVYDTLGNLLSANDLGIYNENPNYYAYEYFRVDNEGNIFRFVKDTKDYIKYDVQNNIIFHKQFQGNGTITGMVVNAWNSVYLSGYFSSSTMSFDGLTTSKAGGNTDAILIKFNGDNGNVDWLKNSQDSNCDRYDFINIDAIGNIYVLNNQYGWCVSPGKSMLAKYNPNGNLLHQNILDGSNLPNPSQITTTRASNISLAPNGGNIIVTGTVNYGQNNPKGFIIEYGVCNASDPTVTLSNYNICQGEQATLSVDSLPNYHYLWSNGDTTATIEVNDVGRYSVVAIQNDECYSESEDFYINVHPYPDTSVTVQNNILTATDTTQGLFYQWIDCQNNNMPISGATEQTFEPAQNGEYAVIVTSENGCSDTSACHVVNTLSIQNNPLLDKQITLYPNPTSDKINVQTDLDIAEVYLLDLQGKQLQTSNSKEVDLSKLSSGIYLIKVKLKNNEVWTRKVIKN